MAKRVTIADVNPALSYSLADAAKIIGISLAFLDCLEREHYLRLVGPKRERVTGVQLITMRRLALLGGEPEKIHSEAEFTTAEVAIILDLVPRQVRNLCKTKRLKRDRLERNGSGGTVYAIKGSELQRYMLQHAKPVIDLQAARRRREAGESMQKIADSLGIPRTTLQKKLQTA